MKEKKSKIQIFKLISSSAFGTLGSSVLSFIIGILILRNTKSVLNFGFSQMISPIISLLLLPFIGGIVDKYNKKIIVVLSQILSIVALVIYSLLLSDNIQDNILYTYILLVCLGISDKFLTTAYQTATSEIVLENHIQKLQSLKQSVNSIIRIFSPVIASLLVSSFSLKEFVYFEILMEILTMLIVLTVNFKFVKKDNNGNIQKNSVLILFKEGISYISKSNTLVFMFIFSMILNFSFSAISIGYPIVMIKTLSFTDTLYAITNSSFSFGMIISGILLSTKKDIEYPLLSAMNYQKIFCILVTLFGALLLFDFSMSTFFIIFVVNNIVMSYLLTLTNVPLMTWFLKAIPIDYQGRIFAFLDTISQLLIPLGILFYSFMFENIHSSFVFVFSGIFSLIFCFVIPKILKVDLKTNSI